jgi:hypothetical protein
MSAKVVTRKHKEARMSLTWNWNTKHSSPEGSFLNEFSCLLKISRLATA